MKEGQGPGKEAMTEKIKRNERMAVMMQVLTTAPNRIFTLSHFAEMFDAAKSTVSEDVALLEKAVERFSLGRLETVTGASGGVRYRPALGSGGRRAFIEDICQKLSDPSRVLPGGFLYYADILSDPEMVTGMGNLIAGACYGLLPDFVLTMETKGIPVAMMAARALGKPLVIARHTIKAYEGSAVNTPYVSASGGIETMSLPRRAVENGKKALIVDDFMRGGGTISGMKNLMREFDVEIVGTLVVLAMEAVDNRLVDNVRPLMLLGPIQHGETPVVRPADWI